MGRQKSVKLPPQPGWVVYLRTSSEEAQNPENSQRRQRHAIETALFERSPMPKIGEYIDNLSGKYASNRPGYQLMLQHARAGSFSHVAVENAERFGRNDTEALTAIDALHELGVSVRFADYPELDPIDPDDRILVTLSFTLARRESIKLGQRVSGGLHAKLRNGGFVGFAPDGYINCEEKAEQTEKSRTGRYSRWIEPDPGQFKVWRMAWDLLLTDQYTLAGICEALHERGYRFRSGRPFITVSADGKRREAANSLSRIFNNWFYAGWVVSEKAGIPPKTIKGQWKPLVTTEEFEQGLAVLFARQHHRASGGAIHDYLLRGLAYVQLSDRTVRLTGSTSNAGRQGGGTAYYCIASSSVNIQCKTVDDQIRDELLKIQVDPELIPSIQASYNEEVAAKLGRMRPDQRSDYQRKLKVVDEEESRALRLYASGKITDRVWEQLWLEWQDRRRVLRRALESFETQSHVYVRNLDVAILVIAKVGILYDKLARSDQKKLLREMVNRVVVSPEGKILRMELLPPFAYLKEVSDRVRNGAGIEGKTKTSLEAGHCSSFLTFHDPGRIRTYNQMIKSHLRYRCATGPFPSLYEAASAVAIRRGREYPRFGGEFMPVDSISLQVYSSLYASIAEEMGETLRRTAFSPNIRERLDYSCALFDSGARMIAQAAHIPVHLGSMPQSVRAAVSSFPLLNEGDVVILNDPYRGGTHLPDITMVSPVLFNGSVVFFVASRAHHADVGGMSPGSLPLSTELYQEGLIIPPVKLVEAGHLNTAVASILTANSRGPTERVGDFEAQLSANRAGSERIRAMIRQRDISVLSEHADALLDYARRMTEAVISSIPDGEYTSMDALEGDGQNDTDIPIRVTVRVLGASMQVDFTGTATQVVGNVNTVKAVAQSATWYCIRLLAGEDVPVNDGCFAPIDVIVPEGCLLNARFPAAVAVGNTETSQRIVDAVLGALALALPGRIPAASQGSMNNITIGIGGQVYYETIGGGHGGGPQYHGLSGRHSHMTNTRNTPVEALERAYALRVVAYHLREKTGGNGRYRGGDGIVREYEMLVDATATINSERRRLQPYGLGGGEGGACGANILTSADNSRTVLPAKATMVLHPGDRLRIETPGGGGWGNGVE